MKQILLLAAATLAFTSIAFAQSNPPVTRTVSGHVLTSKDTPAVRLEFDKAFKYVGTQSFVLYDVANAEQHFFVDADKDGRIKLEVLKGRYSIAQRNALGFRWK